MNSHLTAVIPASREFVQTLRAVVGSASVLLDATVETIQDLQLVVDEACGLLLDLGNRPTQLQMRVEMDQARIHIEISSDAPPADWSEAVANPLAERILSALTDRYDLKSSPKSAVVMVKTLTESKS